MSLLLFRFLFRPASTPYSNPTRKEYRPLEETFSVPASQQIQRTFKSSIVGSACNPVVGTPQTCTFTGPLM